MEEFLARLIETYDSETIESVRGPISLIGGFILGLMFGVVLQKGRMCKYDTVTGLFRLQDFTVFRLGTPLMMVSVVLIYFLTDMGIIELHVPGTKIVPQIVGGLMFGTAIAILGYCPGTAAGALGEGMLDAIPAVLGMITGSVIFAELFYNDWKDTFLTFTDVGRVTFPDILGINHWFIIVFFLLMLLMFLLMITMMDWFIIFMKRSLNYFRDFTDGVETKLPSSSQITALNNENEIVTESDKEHGEEKLPDKKTSSKEESSV